MSDTREKKLSFLNVTIYKRPPFFTRIVTVQLMKMMCDVYCFKPEVVCGRERKRMRKNKTKKGVHKMFRSVGHSYARITMTRVLSFFSHFFFFLTVVKNGNDDNKHTNDGKI